MYLLLTRVVELYASTASMTILLALYYLVLEVIIQYLILFQWLLRGDSELISKISGLFHNSVGFVITVALIQAAIYCESMVETVSLDQV